MMESRHVLAIAKSRSSSLVMSAAMVLAITGLAQAGTVNMPITGGAVRAWSVPYNPTSVGMVAGLQGFLRTETGSGLLEQAPSLGIISGLNPDSEAHRRIIGALGLAADFETQLQTAIQTSHNKALTGALGTILSAYQSQNAEEKINEAIQARADEIAAAVSHGKMSVTELSAAALELAPFASVSVQAKAVVEMASAARSANTMDAAQRIASSIMQNKGYVSVDGANSVVSGTGQKDIPKEWRLQPAIARTVDWGADMAAVKKVLAAYNGPSGEIDLATMARLVKGYAILNGRLVYGGGNADADLLLQLSGKKFEARGVLEAEFHDGIINKIVYVYLKSEDGSRKVYLYANSFFRTKSAQRYLQSLPTGASVIARLTVIAPSRLVSLSSSPFAVEIIERVGSGPGNPVVIDALPAD